MRMIHGSRILQIALIISLSVSLSSCGVGRTLDILESAIEELGAQPAKWEETLKGAIDEFGWVTIGVVHQVRQEIESLMR